MAGGRTSLYERQWNEVDAIRSIYIDEYEELTFPWNIDHPPLFVLHLKDESGPVPVAVDLEFKLTPNYPETPPEIQLHRKSGIQSSQVSRIQESLMSKAKDCLGAEMIYDLIEHARGLLSDAAKHKVSFYDEMIMRKGIAPPAEERLDEEAAEDQPASSDVEEVTRKIREELSVKDQRLQTREEKSAADKHGTVLRLLTFEPPIRFELVDSSQPLVIDRVKIGEPLSMSCDCYYGVPFAASSEDGSLGLMAFLVRIEGSFYHTTQGRKKLMALCRRVEELAKARPSSLYCRPLGATVLAVSERASDLWIVTEPHSGISLERLVECSGSLSLPKSTAYLEQILQAVHELHANNIIHQDVVASNVMISTVSSRIRLVNVAIARLLRDLHQTHPLSARLEIPDDIAWRPPESLSRGSQLGKKSDIWFIGHLALQLLCGMEFTKAFGSAEDALDAMASRLPPVLVDLLRGMLAKEPSTRLSAGEAALHACFSASSLSECQLLHPLASVSIESPHVSTTGILDTPRRPAKAEASRYSTDFEEIQFLGRGAHGEVIKVRNRIDNRFYAIKRIRLDPLNVEYNSRILREVTTLSRLHHERVVRYYQAWIEGGPSLGPPGGESPFASLEESGLEESEASTGECSDERWTTEGISSMRLYSSTVGRGGTSLSSLVQFHTGFTSDEEQPSTTTTTASALDDGSDDVKAEAGPQYLYIQMEYCPNQTLRDVIDMGVEEEETWRLFRQIVEGLSYLHSQGMIHRDLKPGNVFLDTNGDVKIGDFGLAVGNDRERERLASTSTPTLTPSTTTTTTAAAASDDVDTLTGGIGTPLYVSPEQETPGARYNQKVDMYSLGVILLEMLVPFTTGMERAITIKAARSAEVILPEVLVKSERQNGLLIVRNLLNHDPRLRFSADELLKSELLPAKVEDEHVNEVIRTITTTNSPHHSRLMTSLFSQPPDPIKNYTFEYHAETVKDPLMLMGLDEISGILATLFRRYGALRIDPSLLLPKEKEEDDAEAGPLLLMPSGQLVHLPRSLVRPFARYIATNGVTDMKRFQIGSTYTTNVSGGQPRHSLEAAYDVVFSSQDPLLPTLEVLRVALDGLLQNTAGLSLSLVLRVNHHALLGPVLNRCLVPVGKIGAVLGVLAETHHSSWSKIKSALSSQVVLPPSTIESIGKLATLKDLAPLEALKRMNEHLRGLRECASVLRYMELLVSCIPSLGINVRVVFEPLLFFGSTYSGAIFQVGMEDRRRSEVLACGGEYKELINGYRIPSDRLRHVNAVGVIFQLSRLWTLKVARGTKIKRTSPVLVYSSGADMLGERLAVTAELWKAGLMVEVVREDSITPDLLSHIVRLKGIVVAVHLKDHCSRGPFGVVKLKQYERRQEVEVAKPELIDNVLQFLAGPERASSSAPTSGSFSLFPSSSSSFSSSSSHDPTQHPNKSTIALHSSVSVSLFSPFSKIKGHQRSMIMDKTMRAVAPLLASFTGGRTTEVVAHDLAKGLLRDIVDTLSEGEEVFRRHVESSDREAALKMRNLLRDLKAENNLLVLLYNYREENIELVAF